MSADRQIRDMSSAERDREPAGRRATLTSSQSLRVGIHAASTGPVEQ